MSEHEKRLYQQIIALAAGSMSVTDDDAHATLESLIAEHRAEVERLTAEVTEQIQATETLVSSASDAALEEGILAIDAAFERDQGVAAQDVLRALQSRPVSVLPAERVREVVPYLRTVCGLSEQEVGEVLRRLGVDLDATGGEKTCPYCHEVHGRLTACHRKPRVYEEPAHEVPEGTCKGCDAPAEAPPARHRFSCSVHGKRQLKLGAKQAHRIEDGHWKGEDGCLDTCPKCAGEGESEPLATPPLNPKADRVVTSEGHWQQGGACMAECPRCAND